MRRQRGFTLVEVMIAIAILALALSTVFGSNIGAARSTARARMMTRATLMARCRVTEAEAWLQKNLLPEDLDKVLEDPPDGALNGQPCCTDGVVCEVHVEKIELPSPANLEQSAGDRLLGRAANAAAGSTFGRGGGDGGVPGLPGAGGAGGGAGGAFGALAGAMTTLGGAGGSSSGSGSSRGGSLGSSGAPSPQEMATSLLTTVYPTIKPLLEGAIRRMTVHVRWNEGTRERSFDVVEYVTNPGQTLAAGELGGTLGGTPLTPGTGTGTGTTPTTPTTPTLPRVGGP